MKKKLTFLALLFIVTIIAIWPFRIRGQNAGWTVVAVSGSPTGSCGAFQVDIDTATGNIWTCKASVWVTAAIPSSLPLRGTTATITGTLLALGGCDSGTVTITGATTSMPALATPVTDPGTGVVWNAFVSSANTVTVKECALVAGTPNNTAYNVVVNP